MYKWLTQNGSIKFEKDNSLHVEKVLIFAPFQRKGQFVNIQEAQANQIPIIAEGEFFFYKRFKQKSTQYSSCT